MTVPRGSEALQLRLPDDKLKNVQAATPLTLLPSAPPALPTLPRCPTPTQTYPLLTGAKLGATSMGTTSSLSPFSLLS